MDKINNTHPHISFHQNWAVTPEIQYQIGECDAMCRTIAHSPMRKKDIEKLLQVSLIKGAHATTAIEGNTLSEEDIENIINKHKQLPPSRQYQQTEVENVINTLNDILNDVVHKKADSPLTPHLIQNFHQHIMRNLGQHADTIPGKWREDERVVGPYRAPNHQVVPELMEKLCRWIKDEFGYPKPSFASALIAAIVAHVYIEWIHPFGDGNGRTGRMVEFYILLRQGLPSVASHILSNYYNLTRTEYYRQLNETRKNRDLTGFIAYAVQGFRDGLMDELEAIQKGQLKTFWRNHVYDTLSDRTYGKKNQFKRQREVALCAPFEGEFTMDDAIMKTPLEIIRDYTRLSDATKRRDFKELVKMGIFKEAGNNKYAVNSDVLLTYLPVKK
ncbi:Fic family protein [Desulfosarcina sp. OttesenSCG-928-A07]|nr:Fic family protein [Desulfosarcina sp. OttesenSCG-928-G17]MDL2328806.1 Fic family protein [Desulfosarcina sp. OttesenSCG-928-A07]